jgi:hypothetical protein
LSWQLISSIQTKRAFAGTAYQNSQAFARNSKFFLNLVLASLPCNLGTSHKSFGPLLEVMQATDILEEALAANNDAVHAS